MHQLQNTAERINYMHRSYEHPGCKDCELNKVKQFWNPQTLHFPSIKSEGGMIWGALGDFFQNEGGKKHHSFLDYQWL